MSNSSDRVMDGLGIAYMMSLGFARLSAGLVMVAGGTWLSVFWLPDSLSAWFSGPPWLWVSAVGVVVGPSLIIALIGTFTDFAAVLVIFVAALTGRG